MKIACDEAGHTGPDLLATDQRFFAFASVCVDDEEAWGIIQEARARHSVQMPELKASRLMNSRRGQGLVADVISAIQGRFAVNAHDKLLALCGWVFEYVYEPVLRHDLSIFYKKNLHRFIAMYAYLWFQDPDSRAPEAITQFQRYMRSKDIRDAPTLFDQALPPLADGVLGHPFELVLRFAYGYRPEIAHDNACLPLVTADAGTWVLDLSASALWSHLNHWGLQSEPLEVQCDVSKPLQSVVSDFRGNEQDPTILRARELGHDGKLGWQFAKPIEFVDSRDHPAVQIADLVASTATRVFSRGLPEGFEATVEILNEGMLRDSIFPDWDVIDLKHREAAVNYLILYELATRADRRANPLLDIEGWYRTAEASWTRGEFRFPEANG